MGIHYRKLRLKWETDLMYLLDIPDELKIKLWEDLVCYGSCAYRINEETNSIEYVDYYECPYIEEE